MKILLERGYNEKAIELTAEEIKTIIKNARKQEREYGEPCSRQLIIDKVIGDKIYVRKDNTNYWDY